MNETFLIVFLHLHFDYYSLLMVGKVDFSSVKNCLYQFSSVSPVCTSFLNAFCCVCFHQGGNLCLLFADGRSLVAQGSVHFENKKCTHRRKQSRVSCRTFHAASYSAFCFLIKRIRLRRENNEKHARMVR